MAVVYLALHKIVASRSRKPGSKLLWFFTVLTSPLTRPVSAWIAPGATGDRLLTAALLSYGVLWLLFVIADRLFGATAR